MNTNSIIYKQKAAALYKAQSMLEYWQSKDAAWWIGWHGKDKNEIIQSWKDVVKHYETELERMNSK